MADYREISQEYAKGGIRAIILLNSGGLITAYTQAGELTQLVSTTSYSIVISFLLIGTILGATTWLVAFLAVRLVDKADQGEISSYAPIKPMDVYRNDFYCPFFNDVRARQPHDDYYTGYRRVLTFGGSWSVHRQDIG